MAKLWRALLVAALLFPAPVAGRGGELYYTQDHYKSFRRIRE
jgi:hypothetical protein